MEEGLYNEVLLVDNNDSQPDNKGSYYNPEGQTPHRQTYKQFDL